MGNNENLQEIGEHLRLHVMILGGFVVAIWLLEAVDWAVGGRLDQFGIIPRQLIGLRGIIAAPMLHGSFTHVTANTVPFVVLGWFVILRGVKAFAVVTAFALVIGGLGTWLIAPATSIHIGASGLIFGFFGYLLFRGYFERSWQSIALAAVVLVLYGGMLLGLLPTAVQVSWQMHLFGFIGGALAAYVLSRIEKDADASTVEPPA